MYGKCDFGGAIREGYRVQTWPKTPIVAPFLNIYRQTRQHTNWLQLNGGYRMIPIGYSLSVTCYMSVAIRYLLYDTFYLKLLLAKSCFLLLLVVHLVFLSKPQCNINPTFGLYLKITLQQPPLTDSNCHDDICSKFGKICPYQKKLSCY